jgi:hypothetical protein
MCGYNWEPTILGSVFHRNRRTAWGALKNITDQSIPSPTPQQRKKTYRGRRLSTTGIRHVYHSGQLTQYVIQHEPIHIGRSRWRGEVPSQPSNDVRLIVPGDRPRHEVPFGANTRTALGVHDEVVLAEDGLWWCGWVLALLFELWGADLVRCDGGVCCGPCGEGGVVDSGEGGGVNDAGDVEDLG